MQVFTIDCEYVLPQTAAAFLLEDHGELAFIENNTPKAVPKLLNTLTEHGFHPQDVRFIIITHVHLDHASGTAELLQHCPQAQVLAHPKAAKHLVRPERLVESAKAVYGEKLFQEMFGEIQPVEASRVFSPEDGASVDLGHNKLHFIYTKGHANHHFCILYSGLNIVFTGDTFGLAYPALQSGKQPFLYATTSPTDFHYEEACASAEKIADLGAQAAYLTHFGAWHNIPLGKAMLKTSLDYSQEIFLELVRREDFSSGENSWAFQKLLSFYEKELNARGLGYVLKTPWLKMDLELNTQGIAFAAQRFVKKHK